MATKAAWLELAATVNDLWPNSPWLENTIGTGFLLCADLPDAALRKALGQLAHEGSGFAPGPAQLYARAEVIAGHDPEIKPLPAPDFPDPLTEEQHRMDLARLRRLATDVERFRAAAVLEVGRGRRLLGDHQRLFLAFMQHMLAGCHDMADAEWEAEFEVRHQELEERMSGLAAKAVAS